MTSGLEIRGVEVQVGPDEILGPISYSLQPGEILVVTGGGGGERGAVVDAFTGVGRPLRGTVTLDGSALEVGTAGVVTRRHDLLGGLTAAENVAVRLLGRARGHADAGSTTREIEAVLSSLALPKASWHNLVEQLSGGQQQRVALARALVGSPPLLALHDPTSELDSATAEIVWEAIGGAAARGAVVVVATDAFDLQSGDVQRLDLDLT